MRIAAVLSSLNLIPISPFDNFSHNIVAGTPSVLIAASIATISASVEECDVQVCLIDLALSGINVFGPITAKKAPDDVIIIDDQEVAQDVIIIDQAKAQELDGEAIIDWAHEA